MYGLFDYWDEDYYEGLEEKCLECGASVEWEEGDCPVCGTPIFPTPPGGFSPGGRPHWGPRQVRTLRGIKPGNVIVEVCGRDQSRISMIVMSEPYTRERDKAVAFDWVFLKDQFPRLKQNWSLADSGVIPYAEDGSWNRINYLLRTGRRRLDISKLDMED